MLVSRQGFPLPRSFPLVSPPLFFFGLLIAFFRILFPVFFLFILFFNRSLLGKPPPPPSSVSPLFWSFFFHGFFPFFDPPVPNLPSYFKLLSNYYCQVSFFVAGRVRSPLALLPPGVPVPLGLFLYHELFPLDSSQPFP